MSSDLKSLFSRVVQVTLAILLVGPVSSTAQQVASLSSQPITIEKKTVAISPAALEFLQSRDGDKVDVWVFFTDKGVFNKSSFDNAASAVSISDKVLARRAKSGVNSVLFCDLPVINDYVLQVQQSGAEHRRTSKWLNAASFSVPVAAIPMIAELPFVAYMRPLAKSKVIYPEIEPAEIQPDSSIQPLRGLEYGAATAQLVQIGVPAAHDQGFTGAGVTLAIFDTGYRKSHEVFAQHYTDGRVLAEYDFIFEDGNTANEAEDVSNQWDHGTLIWSTAAGHTFSQQVGPAYHANFLLAKTEDLRSETPAEEDNWVAAVEWSDSLGADVITSSLCYSDWYSYSQYDGETATITIAANTAAGLGILVCNAMGNSGPSLATLLPPADAFEILACGAVSSSGSVASFSSRGPSADGRIKPEVMARGVSTAAATTASDDSYGSANGTSLSTPLVAGAACLLIEARPNFPLNLIRTALMETADNASTPDNAYGWGIINLEQALLWGSNFSADQTFGDAPMTVQFTNLSTIPATSYDWDFGDGGSSILQNPVHQYTQSGIYDVSLTIATTYGPITGLKSSYIIAKGDTLTLISDSAYAGQDVVINVHLTNSMPTDRIIVPIVFEQTPDISLDSMQLGARTSYFERLRFLTQSPTTRSYTPELTANIGGGAPPLSPGSGEILKLFFSTNPYTLGGQSNLIDSTLNFTYHVSLITELVNFIPNFHPGYVSTRYVLRGDANGSDTIDISDLTYMVTFLYALGPAPITIQSGDINYDLLLNITDLTFLVDYMFNGGSAPPQP